jgi:hypothetical protein
LVALDDDLLPIAFELGVDPGRLQRSSGETIRDEVIVPAAG